MNTTYFKSIHALWALLIASGFVVWLVLGEYSMGRAAGSDRGYLLWSGWVALTLFFIVGAYSLRKYIHKLGWSPEFRYQADPKAVEQTEDAINNLNREIAEGRLINRSDMLSRAKLALSQAGTGRIFRPELDVEKIGEVEHFSVYLSPKEPLGRMAKWMHAHLFLGLGAAILVLVHGGGQMATPMGALLNGLSAVVILTGLFGIVIWATGPAKMTAAETDLSIEEAFVLSRHYERKVTAAFAELGDDDDLVEHFKAAADDSGDFAKAAEAGLSQLTAKDPADSKGHVLFQDIMALIGQRQRVNRSLQKLMRVRRTLNLWRAIHVPASVFLLGLLVFHVFSVWWY